MGFSRGLFTFLRLVLGGFVASEDGLRFDGGWAYCFGFRIGSGEGERCGVEVGGVEDWPFD